MDGQGVVAWIIIGLVAGLLANIVLGGSSSLFGMLVAGLIGSVVGGWLSARMRWRLNLGNPLLDQVVISFIGAVIVVLVARLVVRL